MSRVGITLLSSGFLALSGCAGGNAIDRAVPQAAAVESLTPLPDSAQPMGDVAVVDASVADAPQAMIPLGTGQPALTGRYPNINVEPGGAVAQMTDAERDALLLEMQALADAQAKGGVSRADYERRLAELRHLAATHSQAAIDTIEE
ncbi:hypothetical protein [Oricola thermophila]|uniref:SHOCT domain-containing protein n=1 Tax=Oricola thermophila TaxID=2742145 RepID=A0A6N1VA06_9HYPH|nr:hypothetical protein [Oricola thermophila]QKV17794.1 hypothetical protein HTY61_04640 [Oricola thermophila]